MDPNAEIPEISEVRSRLAEIEVERARLDAEEDAFVRHLCGLAPEEEPGDCPPYS